MLEKGRDSLEAQLTDLRSYGESKDSELVDLNASLTSVKSQNDSLAGQLTV